MNKANVSIATIRNDFARNVKYIKNGAPICLTNAVKTVAAAYSKTIWKIIQGVKKDMSKKINDKQYNIATKEDYKIFDRRTKPMTSRKCKWTFEYVRCNSDCKNCVVYENSPIN